MEVTSHATDKFVDAARNIKSFTQLPEWIYNQRISARPDPSSLPWLNDLLKVRMKSLSHIDNPMYLALLENKLSAEQLDHFMCEYYWGSGYGFQRLVLPEVQNKNGNAVWKDYIKGIILEENTPEPHHGLFRNYMLKLGIDAGQGKAAIPAAANEFNSNMLAGYKASLGYAMGYALGIETEADFQISLLYLACLNRDPTETLHDPYFDIHMAEDGEEAHARFTCECIEKMLEAGEITRNEIEEGFIQAIVDTRDYMRTIHASLPCASDDHRDEEKDNMKEKIYAIIATVAETSPDKVHGTQELNADLGIDSLKLIDLVLGVEGEFSITLSEDALASITTVDELEGHIESLLAEPQQS